MNRGGLIGGVTVYSLCSIATAGIDGVLVCVVLGDDTSIGLCGKGKETEQMRDCGSTRIDVCCGDIGADTGICCTNETGGGREVPGQTDRSHAAAVYTERKRLGK